MEQDINKGERIAKRMARAGLCSRRDAERWIADGRVMVNGKKLETAACVVTDADEVKVDGKIIGAAQETRLFLYHKPAGLVTSHKDEQGRATVFESLPGLPRVVSVGRLDINTEGLLLLTNDGELSRYMELPTTGWRRRYRVRVHGNVDVKKLERLKRGTTVDGVTYKSIEASLDADQGVDRSGKNTWLSVVLTEGKNREVRRVMEHLGLQVNRLIRVSYGPFNLGNMARGAVQEVKQAVLREQVKGFFKGR